MEAMSKMNDCSSSVPASALLLLGEGRISYFLLILVQGLHFSYRGIRLPVDVMHGYIRYVTWQQRESFLWAGIQARGPVPRSL
jgi:hypothetical protein